MRSFFKSFRSSFLLFCVFVILFIGIVCCYLNGSAPDLESLSAHETHLVIVSGVICCCSFSFYLFLIVLLFDLFVFLRRKYFIGTDVPGADDLSE